MAKRDLIARDVQVRAGSTILLDRVDLRLQPGELCGLIGPSGAGKSTLIRALLGLRRPSGGQVTLGGGPPGASGAVGYVPQDDALHRALTPRQALGFAAELRLHGMDGAARAARIDEVMAQVGLSERADVRVRRLSGGQRKRVSVALELLNEPELLILDEPTSGLDPGLEARSMALFREVAEGGRIVMVATHATASLEQCHALAVLVKGRIAYFGAPRDALEWFQAGSYAGIFERLPLRAPEAWDREWRRSPLRSAFEARQPARAGGAPGPTGAPRPGAPGPAGGAEGGRPAAGRDPDGARGPASRADLEAQLEEIKASLRRKQDR